jgi:hypothetical protein
VLDKDNIFGEQLSVLTQAFGIEKTWAKETYQT